MGFMGYAHIAAWDAMVQLIPPLFGLLFWLLVLLAFNHVVAGVRLVLMGFIVVRTCSFLSLYWQRPAAAAVVPAEPLLTGSQ
jgi:succinate dehydrogenase/fumarate reductase cytochrome b subunit